MRIATPLCLLLLLVWPVAQAGPSEAPSEALDQPVVATDGSSVRSGPPEELQVSFHERKPFLEPLELVEPEEDVDPDWGSHRLKLEFFEVGRVSGGVHDGAEIVLLRLQSLDSGPCKGEGCGLPYFRYLRYLKNGGRMILLGAISDRRFPGKASGSGGRFLGQDPFARFDLVEERDETLTIPGFERLPEITGPEPRQILRLVDEQEGRPDSTKLVTVFTHPRLGEIYTTRPELSPSNRIYSYKPSGLSSSERPHYDTEGTTPESCYGNDCYATNAFFVFRPDGTLLRYRYTPDLDTTRSTWLVEADAPHAAAYTFRSRISCSATLVDDSAVVDPDSLGLGELKQVAVAPEGGPLFAPAPQHRSLKELYEFYVATFRYGSSGEPIDERMSFDDFARARPILLWRDPFGRLIRFTRTDFLQPHFCEPIVYLYPPAAQRVVVSLAGGIVPSASTPEYGAGWEVLALPCGELRDARDGKNYPYLFWEAPSPFTESPEEGSVVPVADVEGFLRDALTRLGLNEKERADFLEAWLPLLDDAPYYFISFFDRRSIDALAPLKVTPAPDTVIRVLMDYRPLDAPIEVAPQKLGPPPPREGFTLVEWGGLRR